MTVAKCARSFDQMVDEEWSGVLAALHRWLGSTDALESGAPVGSLSVEEIQRACACWVKARQGVWAPSAAFADGPVA